MSKKAGGGVGGVGDDSSSSSSSSFSGPGTFLRRLRQGVVDSNNSNSTTVFSGIGSSTPSISTKKSDLQGSSSSSGGVGGDKDKEKEKSNATSASPMKNWAAGGLPIANPRERSASVAPTSTSSSTSSTSSATLLSSSDSTLAYRLAQFDSLLEAENIDLVALRKLSWNGIPTDYRTQVWQLMLAYLPSNKSRRDTAIARKRKEYADSVDMYFEVAEADRGTQEGEVLRQIQVDLPRTSPDTPFFQQRPIQRMLERILYVWSIRHPASGYVQGMNDLLCPLLYICMQPFVSNVLQCDVEVMKPDILSNVEADAYWCLTKLLDNIQDHYTFSQPGLQRMVLRLEDLVRRNDTELHNHLIEEGLQYIQFSFRWMNCLLLREFPLRAMLRIWDTYFAEEHGFENLHVNVCAVLLIEYKAQIKSMHFQEILMFLQDLPTSTIDEKKIESILSQAYIYSYQSASHLS